MNGYEIPLQDVTTTFDDIEKTEQKAKAAQELAVQAHLLAVSKWDHLFDAIVKLREKYSESDDFWNSKMGKLFAKFENLEGMLGEERPQYK